MLLFMCCYEAKCHTACMMLQVAGPTSTAAGSLREGLGHLTTQGRRRHLYGRAHWMLGVYCAWPLLTSLLCILYCFYTLGVQGKC